jgi:hypothetical protein
VWRYGKCRGAIGGISDEEKKRRFCCSDLDEIKNFVQSELLLKILISTFLIEA